MIQVKTNGRYWKSDLFLYTGDNLDPVAKKIAKTINDKDKTLSLESTLDKIKIY